MQEQSVKKIKEIIAWLLFLNCHFFHFARHVQVYNTAMSNIVIQGKMFSRQSVKMAKLDNPLNEL